MNEREKELERALLMCAASCQGGHSDAGMAAAEALGTTFPITMVGLAKVAMARGYSCAELWPWWTTQLVKREIHRSNSHEE